MPEVLAAIRPDDQGFALLLHLVGATVAVGALLVCATSLALARSEIPCIGFVVADWSAVPFLVALALGGVGVYRLRNGKGAPVCSRRRWSSR